MDTNNNLGISVTLHNLNLIKTTLCNSHEYLESLLQWHPRVIADMTHVSHTYAERVSPPRPGINDETTWFLKSFFANAFSLYLSGTYARPDLGYTSSTLSASTAIELNTQTDDMWEALRKFSESNDIRNPELPHVSLSSETFLTVDTENGLPNSNNRNDFAPAAVLSPKRYRAKSEMLPTSRTLTPKFRSSNTLESLGSALDHSSNHNTPDPVWSEPPTLESSPAAIPLSNMFVPLESTEAIPLNKKKKGKIKAKRDNRPRIDISSAESPEAQPASPVTVAETPLRLVPVSVYYFIPILIAIAAGVIAMRVSHHSSPSHANTLDSSALSNVTGKIH